MAKIVLKCGDIEIEYDGPEDFLKAELATLVRAVSDIRAFAHTKKASAAGHAHDVGGGGPASVSTIAQQLGVKNAPELIMSAALSYVRGGAESFTKKELRDKIKDAKSFYKGSYSNNFDNYVARLVKKGRLNHLGGDDYSIPPTELTALNDRLSLSTT